METSKSPHAPKALSHAIDVILQNKRNLCLAGCGLMLIAVFFTFATIEVSLFGFTQSESKRFIEGDGWLVLVAALVAGALIWFKKEKFSLIATGIALATTLYDMSNIGDAASQTGGLAKVSFGLSPWLIILGVLLAAGPIVFDILVAKGIIKPSNP